MKSFAFPELEVASKNGDERFALAGANLELRLIDFWRWSASDLTNNAARGVLAEFIVASALGLELGETVRREWDAFDLITKEGTKIEVKSAAYLQSWPQQKLSSIRFAISSTYGWNADMNDYDAEAMRQAHIYIFCLLKHQDKSSLEPMNLDQWEFYLLPTQTLNEKCVGQKTIGLAALKKLNPRIVGYEDLAAAVAESGAS